MLDLPRRLEDIHVQPRGDVPGDVAVERPDARVLVDLHDHVRGLGGADGVGQELHVAALGVRGVGHGAVPGAAADGEHVVVVAVDVHRVGPR